MPTRTDQSEAPLVRLGQGSYARDLTPAALRREQRDADHGPVNERLAHAHGSALLLAEYLDEFARELHPDFVAHFWAKLQEHVQRRLASWHARNPTTSQPSAASAT